MYIDSPQIVKLKEVKHGGEQKPFDYDIFVAKRLFFLLISDLWSFVIFQAI